MATYYVGIGGNDGNNGTTWALRKLTLNGAEDIPVAANDTVYVGPGVYREQLTADVSGGAGTPITYIGDVTGEHTDGVGGIVRITGSDNDQTATRSYCIFFNDRDYRTFRGFTFDTTSSSLVYATSDQHYNTWEDCVFIQPVGYAAYFFNAAAASTNNTFRRCVFFCGRGYSIYFGTNAVVDDTDNLIENCFWIGGGQVSSAVFSMRYGDIIVRNCTMMGTLKAVYSNVALNAGHGIDVNNCIFVGCDTALQGASVNDIIEDYNTFYANNNDRNNTNTGANSVTYPPLFLPPILHSGVAQISGYRFPWWLGELSEWSQVRAITGSNEPTEDLRGIVRPTTASKNSWGATQFNDAERETGTVHAGSVSIVLHDAGIHQVWVPVANESTTISVYVYREANYAGTNPRMVIKQPGQADRTTTDAAAASQWNLLTDTFTPAALPPYVVVELQSLNTAVAGNYETFFDDLAVD